MAARTGRGAEHPGFLHEALVYESDDAFLATVVPFLAAGTAAGEPTLLSVSARRQELVLDALDDPGAVTVLPLGEQYAHPYGAIGRTGDMVRERTEAGAAQVRSVGEVPRSQYGRPWHGWVRYEAAINHFFADLPLWAICAYDGRLVDADVLADVERTHPYLAVPEGHAANERFVDPAAFLAARDADVDALEAGTPTLELNGPSPSFARRAVIALAETTSLDRRALEGLELAVGEVVTNALLHGRPPVRVRTWLARDRVVVAVHDSGPGPEDPFAGLVAGGGGLGLHIAYRTVDELTTTSDEHGFTVHLVAR